MSISRMEMKELKEYDSERLIEERAHFQKRWDRAYALGMYKEIAHTGSYVNYINKLLAKRNK